VAAGIPAGGVYLDVDLDTSKAGAKLASQLQGPMSASGDRAGRAFGSRFGSALSGAAKAGAALTAAGGVAVGVGLVKVFREGLSGVQDYQAGLAQAQQVIKTTGGVAGVTADGVENLAAAIEGYSGQDGEAIVKGETLLLTFSNIRNAAGKNNDIFTQATKITADMAQVFGGDASSSAIQLGKALNDPTAGISALSRVGVSFTEGQKKTIKSLQDSGNIMGAQKIILAELSKEVGGSAAAYGETLPGKIARAHRAFEGLSQTLVGAAAPAIEGMADLFTNKLVPGITVFVDAFSGRSEIDEFDGKLKTLNNAGIRLREMFDATRKAVTIFVDAFAGRSEINEFDGKLRTVNNAGILVREGFDKARAGVSTMLASFRGASGPTTGFAGVMASIGARAHDLGPQLASVFDQLRRADFSSLVNGAKVAGPVLAFLADHIGLLVKTLPFLVAGFAAYRVAQAAANVAALARIPLMAAQLGVNLSLAASNKALATAIRGSALAYNEQAGAAGRAAVAGRAAAVGGGAGPAGVAGKAGKARSVGGAALGALGGPVGLVLTAGIAAATVGWAAYTGAANKAKDAVAGVVARADASNPPSLAAARAELEKIANAKPPGGLFDAGIIKLHAYSEGTKAARAGLATLNAEAAKVAAQQLLNQTILQGSAAARLEAAGFGALSNSVLISGVRVIAAQQANISYRGSVDATTAAVAENGRTHNANTAAGRANQSALLGLVDAGKANLNAMVAQRAPADALSAAVTTQRAEFVKQAISMGYSKAEAAHLATQYGLIPRDVTTYVKTKGAAEAEATLARLSPLLRNAHYTQTTSILVSERGLADGDAGLMHGTAPLHRAGGGPTAPRTTYLVGERGAELISTGPSRGYVTKNSDLVRQVASALGGQGQAGAATYSATVNNYGNNLTLAQLTRAQRLAQLQHS